MTNETDALAWQKELFGELQKNWGWLLAYGILCVILGIIGLGMVVTLTLVSVFFFGVLILIGGVAQLIQAFKCKGWKSVVLHVLIAILYVLAGISVIANPAAASMILTLMLAGAIIAVGIVRIVMAIQLRGTKGWFWPLLGGIIALLLGLMIAARWPVSGLWVIGLFLAIELVMNGWSYIFVALAAKEAGKTGGAAEAATA